MRRFLVIMLAVVLVVVGGGAAGARLIPQPQRQYISALTEEIVGPNLLSSALSGSVDEAHVSDTTEPVAPPQPAPRVTTMLVIGSDLRTGAGNTAYGSADGQRSDSAMIVQVNPYIKRTTVVSIPRDLWVKMPQCAGGSMSKFNAAFSLGGVNCTVRLVRQLTGLKLDHVVVLDFNAFKQVVDTLGGVQVCVNHKVKDRYSGLSLKAGVSTLDGEKALSFARSRHSTATGSDLSRIERQQYLLLRLAHVAAQRAKNPVTAFQLLSSVQPYLTVDDTFDTWEMAYLGLDAAGSSIVTKTLPWKVDGSVPWGSVAVDEKPAGKLVAALANPPVSLEQPSAQSTSDAATTAPAAGSDDTTASSPATVAPTPAASPSVGEETVATDDTTTPCTD